MLTKGMLIADRYEIIEKIGSGGMSDVYRARCHKLNRYVAVKVLKQEFSEDESFVGKFRIEAQSVAGLTHANIVNVYDVGDEAGIYYIVMELVEGITLKNYIDKKGKLIPKEAVSIAIQVAQGIEAAHNHGIVHRDIKPQNIIISREGKVKVTDFGIARAASSNTINSNVMGSVHYISPEQARGGYSDYKSDIYSFGIMLFEMLTGRVPFEGDTTVSIALKHIQEEVPVIKDIDSEMPLAISQIVEKCTRKRKENRYESATELIVDLKKALVNPDGTFVGIAVATTDAASAEGKTVMLTKEEIEQIELASKNKNVSEVDNKDPLIATVFSTGPVNKNTGSVSKTIKHDEELELEEEEVNESSNLDKILLAIGICAALILLCLAIYVVSMVFTSLNGDNKKTTAATTTTTTESSDGKVEIPPIVGMNGDEAKKILNARGLGYIVKAYDSDDLYEKGQVITQSLDAGTRVNPNTTVYVTISSGPASFILDDYVGKDGDSIRALLADTYGLQVECEYEFSDEIESGKITKTSIQEGTTVKSGDKITLYISRGKETAEITVPSILTLTQEQANMRLQQNNLEIGEVTYSYSTEYDEGEVMSQSIKGGKIVSSGTVIDYVISKGPEPVIEYEYQGSVTIADFSYYTEPKEPAGKDITKTVVKLVLKQGTTETVILPETDIESISATQFKFVGEDGITTGKVILYAKYTYEVEEETTAATKPTSSTTAATKPTSSTTAATKPTSSTAATTKAPTTSATTTTAPSSAASSNSSNDALYGAAKTVTTELIKVWETDVTLVKTEVKNAG